VHLPQGSSGLLEPGAAKVARRVLRRPRRSNAPGLPDHAAATTWLRVGVPLGEVAKRMGHSVETLVSTYVGALAGDEMLANERIEASHGGAHPYIAPAPAKLDQQLLAAAALSEHLLGKGSGVVFWWRRLRDSASRSVPSRTRAGTHVLDQQASIARRMSEPAHPDL